MKEFTVKNEAYHYVFDPNAAPQCTVDPGDKVIVYTEDAYGGHLPAFCKDSVEALKDVKYYNPLTGPIYINGAEPGDTLAVHIEKIEFTRNHAVSLMMSYFGGLTSTSTTRTLQPSLGDKVWTWEVLDGGKQLRCEELDRTIDADPFYGTLATAPAMEAVLALAPGPFGGNMDVPDVKPGNTVYLPVRKKGALFYIGDCHAVQGNGELCGSAAEITSKGTLSFDLIKGKGIEWPRIESPDAIMTVGSARPMEDAARIAYAELIQWMVEDYGFDQLNAYELLSMVGRLYVGNMVDTNYSLVASIDKRHLTR